MAEVRAAKWRAQKKKNFIRLAPDEDSLHHHLERANYLTYIQKHFNIHDHPSPINNGWHLVDGMCLPIRSTQSALPASISFNVQTTALAENYSDDDSESNDVNTDSCDDDSDSDV